MLVITSGQVSAHLNTVQNQVQAKQSWLQILWQINTGRDGVTTKIYWNEQVSRIGSTTSCDKAILAADSDQLELECKEIINLHLLCFNMFIIWHHCMSLKNMHVHDHSCKPQHAHTS